MSILKLRIRSSRQGRYLERYVGGLCWPCSSSTRPCYRRIQPMASAVERRELSMSWLPHSSIPERVKMRSLHRGGESHQKRQRVKVQSEGTIAEGTFELFRRTRSSVTR